MCGYGIKRSWLSRGCFGALGHTYSASRDICRSLLWCCLGRALVRDDLVLDLLVSGLRNDFLSHQIALRPIGPVIDDLLRERLTNTRQGIELLLACRVDVELVGGRFRFGRSGATL